MSKSIKYQTEEPTDKDLFSQVGGHKQVATAIKNLLITDSRQEIIGIEGTLGGGKSSIIRMLENILDYEKIQEEVETCLGKKKFNFFTFDVDIHHSSLKPSLIERISEKIKEALNDSKDPTAKLKTLEDTTSLALGKKFEYEKETNSTLTLTAITFSILLVLSAATIRQFIVEITKAFTPCVAVNWLVLIISGIFAFLPLLFVLLSLVSEKAKLSLANMLKRNGKDTISEMITINKEVGPIELENTFRTYSNLIPDDTVLVLVLDNIDRLSPKDIKVVWSELEIFASLSDKNFRILLPFSEKHTVMALAEGTDSEAKKTAIEYISKKLPIVFSVPPVITHGWKEQFKKYYYDTFEHNDNIAEIILLIEIWQRGNITPRFLKNLINLIASKVDVCPCDDELNILAVAAYVLAKMTYGIEEKHDFIIELTKKIVKIDTVDEDSEKDDERIMRTQDLLNLHFEDELAWSSQLMALHYQTSEEIAKSELLEEPIKYAIENIDLEEVLNRKDNYAFESVFGEIIKQLNPIQLTKFAAALLKNHPDEKEWIISWVETINKLSNSNKYIIHNVDDNYLKSLIFLKENDVTINQTIIDKLYNELQIKVAIESKGSSGKTVKNLEQAIAPILKLVKDCYACFQITQLEPDFIANLKSDFYILILWRLRDELALWKIKEKLSSFDRSKIINLASASLPRKDIHFLALLDEIRSATNFLKEDIYVTELTLMDDDGVDEAISIYPFTKEWGQSASIAKLCTTLAKAPKASAEDTKAQLAGMILASASKCYASVHTSVDIFNENGTRSTVNLITFLHSQIKNNAEITKHFSAYINMLDDVSKLISFIAKSVSYIDLSDAISDFITNDKIDNQDIDSLFAKSYVELKDVTKNIEPGKLLDWLAGWELPSCNTWAHELLVDLATYRNNKFIEKIQEHFNLPHYDLNYWTTQLQTSSEETLLYMNILSTYSVILENAQAFADAICDFISKENIVQNIKQEFLVPLPSKESKKITHALDNKFKSNTHGDDTRKWIIKNFNNYLLPTDLTPTNLSTIVSFVSLIRSDETYLVDWLKKIPVKNWKLNLLSVGDIESLHESFIRLGLSDVAEKINILLENKQNNNKKEK